jgi:hypothetical protein
MSNKFGNEGFASLVTTILKGLENPNKTEPSIKGGAPDDDGLAKLIVSILKALSNKDIKHILGSDCKIIKYSELANINTIDELLPEEQDYRITLTESQRNSAHWCCIMKYTDPKTG